MPAPGPRPWPAPPDATPRGSLYPDCHFVSMKYLPRRGRRDRRGRRGEAAHRRTAAHRLHYVTGARLDFSVRRAAGARQCAAVHVHCVATAWPLLACKGLAHPAGHTRHPPRPSRAVQWASRGYRGLRLGPCWASPLPAARTARAPRPATFVSRCTSVSRFANWRVLTERGAGPPGQRNSRPGHATPSHTVHASPPTHLAASGRPAPPRPGLIHYGGSGSDGDAAGSAHSAIAR